MAANTARERPTAVAGETRLFSVSFENKLDSGELLTGTPTVAEETTTDLTISNKVVSTAALTINHRSVAIGRAIQFKVSGFLVANSPYTILITCGTDSDPAQTVKGRVKFAVEA